MAAGVSRALTTRTLDFWFLGGASVVVWAVMWVAEFFRANPATEQTLQRAGMTALGLSLVVNYPHFVLSYKLAYTRGGSFVATHWPQLVVVPIGLAALLWAAYTSFDLPVADVPLVAATSAALEPFGANTQVLSGPRMGDLLLGATFNLMTVTIGWHYTKQVFGCVMVYAHLDGYAISPPQRALLKRALLAVWALAIVDNADGSWRAFGTFSYSSFDVPDLAVPLAIACALAGVALVAHRVFYANYRATGRLPHPNLVVPFVALYLWWLPLTRQDEFYFVMAPLFHSLQYLPFVYKMEDARLRSAAHREARAVALAAGVVLTGWLAFEYLPAWFDAARATARTVGLPFFVIASTLFINIHHYFIDNVLWRFTDPQVRAHLLE